ncbi:uncharacterized protein LOC129737679 [Uranotaenia lowii]|uniref:uncharacterized protein LOC129737679 n=1 Tax=Uranotaenia lowii TaxID=190385 RepID=UPI002479CF90|nr:uncharacterized protein LOC129737679 [Uranotaenia lowii]
MSWTKSGKNGSTIRGDELPPYPNRDFVRKTSVASRLPIKSGQRQEGSETARLSSGRRNNSRAERPTPVQEPGKTAHKRPRKKRGTTGPFFLPLSVLAPSAPQAFYPQVRRPTVPATASESQYGVREGASSATGAPKRSVATGSIGERRDRVARGKISPGRGSIGTAGALRTSVVTGSTGYARRETRRGRGRQTIVRQRCRRHSRCSEKECGDQQHRRETRQGRGKQKISSERGASGARGAPKSNVATGRIGYARQADATRLPEARHCPEEEPAAQQVRQNRAWCSAAPIALGKQTRQSREARHCPEEAPAARQVRQNCALRPAAPATLR